MDIVEFYGELSKQMPKIENINIEITRDIKNRKLVIYIMSTLMDYHYQEHIHYEVIEPPYTTYEKALEFLVNLAKRRAALVQNIAQKVLNGDEINPNEY